MKLVILFALTAFVAFAGCADTTKATTKASPPKPTGKPTGKPSG